jgi:hypothetical protein
MTNGMRKKRVGQRCQKRQHQYPNGMSKGVVLFSKQMTKESTMDKMSARKKKFKGFPMFFTFEIF